jgi:hypothetical protein
LGVLTGGFFFFKKPLECMLSVYSNPETAAAPEPSRQRRSGDFPSEIAASSLAQG